MAVAILDRSLTEAEDPTREVLLADAGDDRAWWWFCHDHQLPLDHSSLRATASTEGDNLVIDVTSDVLVRDLVIVLEPRCSSDLSAGPLPIWSPLEEMGDRRLATRLR